MIMNLTRVLPFGAVHTMREEANEKIKTMGYDYKLHISLSGKVNRETGIVVNIVHIDQAIDQVLAMVNGKWLDKDVPFFFDRTYSLENLLLFFCTHLQGLFTDVKLHSIKIQQTPFLFGEMKGDLPMNIYVTKIFHFSSAHRLHSYSLNEKENIDLFGKCNNFYGHGHNYRLEVTVAGQPDPRTGVVTHYGELEKTVNDYVIRLFDHKHMNQDLDWFQEQNPTSEMVLSVIWNLLASRIPKLYKIGLWETEKNYFEYYGPNHG